MTEHGGELKPTRRGMLRTLGRWLGLAAVVGAGGWLIGRSYGPHGRHSGSAAGAAGGPVCGRCLVFIRCTLPRAEDARRQGEGLAGPVRAMRPGAEESAAVPLCPEGRSLSPDAPNAREESL